jgi:hypothetical protein
MKAYRVRFAWMISAAATAVVLAPQPGISATEVNTCGQVVSGSTYLAADLDCTGFSGDAITLQGGTLDLRGFALTGGVGDGVTCTRSCKITSDPAGGTITGASSYGVFGDIAGGEIAHVRISNITVQFNGDGVRAALGNITVTDSLIADNSGLFGIGVSSASDKNAKVIRSTVTGHTLVGVSGGNNAVVVDSDVSSNPGQGVLAGEKAVVRGSTVSFNGQQGISAGPGFTTSGPKVVDSAVMGNGGAGIEGSGSGRMMVIRSNVSGNGGQGILQGLGTRPVIVRESTISGNALEGIRDESAHDTKILQNSTITGNGLHGIYSANTVATPDECTPLIRDSIVTGNGTDADCGVTETCADLAACAVPNLLNVTCDTSYDTLSGFPGTSWGVCALD